MENKAKRFLRLLLAIAMVMAIVPMTFALATEINGTEAISENMVWNDGDVVNGVTISGNVTITVKGTVTVNGTIRLSPDAISNVVFEGEDNAKLIRGSAFTGQMFYAEGVSGNFQNLTFNNITLDGGAVWSGEEDKTLNRGKTNEGVKAASLLDLRYANAKLNESVLQNHDASTSGKASAVYLRYYSTVEFTKSVVRNNNSQDGYNGGGVISVRGGGTVKTNNTEVYGNSGDQGGFYGTSSNDSFGGVVEVYNSKFYNNYANTGAIFDMQCNSNLGYLKIDGCEFYQNASGRGLIYEHAYSRPVIIKDSYFHDNECAVWDCHADPVLDLSGKIVVEEDPDYSKYLFETPLVLSAPLAEGSSIPMSEATVAQLMKSGYLITGTAGYGVSVNDLAKLSLPESYQCVLVDKNSDGFGDLVAYKPSPLVEITLTLKDSKDASASKTGNVYSAIKCLPVNPFAHAGYTFAGWVDAEGNIVGMQNFTEKATLTATWNLEAPIVKLSRDGAILKGTVTNKYEGLTYTYQWYKNDVAIEGATAATYTMTDVNSASYKCIVTVSDGENVVTGSVSGKSSAPAAAQVGETQYATLKEAIDAANDQGTATVTLLKDVEFAGISQGNKVVGLTISGNVTISGAHTITRADTYTGTLFTVNSGATLTLDGGLVIDGNNNWSIDANNVVTPETGKPVATGFMIVNGGTLNVYNATLQNQYSEGTGGSTEGAIIAQSNSVTNLKGATIRHFYTQDAGAAVRLGHGSGSCSNATLNIGEGTNITGNIGDWNGAIIIAYGANTINMTGGSINNNTANSNGTLIMLYNATMNMSGGVITENKGPVSAIYMHNVSNFVMTGGEISKNTGGTALYIRSNADSATISGDSKIVNNSGDIWVSPSKTDDVQISGGVYTQDVSQWCAEGFTCKQLADGIWGVVERTDVSVTVTIQDATMVEGNALPNFTYTTDVEGVPELDISYTVDGTTINATVAEMEGYEFEVVPGTLTVQKALVRVEANGTKAFFVTLEDAMKYAVKATGYVGVHILGDVTVNETIVINDANGGTIELQAFPSSYKITSTMNSELFRVEKTTSFVVKNLTIRAKGDAFYIAGGSLTLQGVGDNSQYLVVSSETGNAVYTRGGNTTVKGGVTLIAHGEYPAIQGNGLYEGNVTLAKWGGYPGVPQVSAPNTDIAIFWPQNGKLTIDAGTITGDTALYAKSGTIIINGGTFKGTGDAKAFAHYSNGAYATGDAVVIESCEDAAYETPVVTITGGKFVSDNANAIGVYNCNKAKPMTKFISGGLFSSAPAPEWCAEGMGPKHAEDNMWTVGTGIVTVDGVYFDDWKVAKTYIHGSSVIVLYAAVENEGSFSVGAANKTVTLDLNGHKFTTTTIGVDGHKTLHITDSGKNGSVVVTNYTALYANGYLDIASDVNFNSYIQINRHSDDQQPSTGCLLIDGVKWIGRGHYQAEDLGIIGTTGGYVTIKNNFQNITFNSGKFTLNADADFTKFAEKLKEDEKTKQGVTVYKEATMNLNGHMLTTNSIVSFSELIDDPVDKTKVETGGVKVSPNHIKLPEYEDYNPKYMPIYDSANGCFRFYKFEMVSLGYKKLNETGAAVKFGVALRFVNAEAYSLLANPNNSPYMSLNFTLALEGMGITIAYEYDPAEFNKWAIEAHAHYTTQGYKGDYALILNVGGLDKLDAEAKLHVTPTLNIQCPADEPGKFVGIFSASSEVMTAPAVPTTSTDATEATNKDEETESVDNSKNSAAGGDDDNDTKAQ